MHALIGAYVLDAVSNTERRAFELHLARCPTCAQQTAELRETVAWLSASAPAVPTPDLWPQIAVGIRGTRQLS